MADKPKEKPKGKNLNKVVRYSNPLNMTSYHLSLFELRVVMSAVANVERDEEIDPNTVYYVNAKDITELGTRKQEVYAALKGVSDTLFKSYATVQMSTLQHFPELQQAFKSSYEQYLKNPLKEVTEKFHFLTSVTYMNGDGKIGFRFSPAFIPFVERLKEQFTEFNLIELSGLRSIFAIRIYTICLQYQNHPDRTYYTTFEELRNILDLNDVYPKFGNFKQRVLDVAIRQINESDYTRFSIDLELVRGPHNKVVQMRFHLNPKAYIEPEALAAPVRRGRKRTPPPVAISAYQAMLTERQISFYADLLAGVNEKAGLEKGYKLHDFVEWLRSKNYSPEGSSTALFAGWLRDHMRDPEFVMKIYNPWLIQLGFKPKKEKVQKEVPAEDADVIDV